MYVITYPQDKQLFKRRLPNVLSVVPGCLRPLREHLKVVAVKSACNVLVPSWSGWGREVLLRAAWTPA